MLGNIDEVSDLSQRLLSLLEGATNGKEFGEQVIGENGGNINIFLMYLSEIPYLFTSYLRIADFQKAENEGAVLVTCQGRLSLLKKQRTQRKQTNINNM